MKKIIICAAAALLMETGAQAVMVSYSVDGAGPIYLGDKSDVNAKSGIGRLDPTDSFAWHGRDAVVFGGVGGQIGDLGTSHASGTMKLNSIYWWMNGEKATIAQNAGDYTKTITRDITLYLGTGKNITALEPEELTQTLTLNVTTKKNKGGNEDQKLTISGGGKTEFSWVDSQGKHEFTITVNDRPPLTGSMGANGNSAQLICGCVTATWDYEVIPAPVPEAATIWAGALLLAPFGLSAFRSLRRNRK